MLWTILVILVVLWLLGFALKVGGGLIHLILVIALNPSGRPTNHRTAHLETLWAKVFRIKNANRSYLPTGSKTARFSRRFPSYRPVS
jgi:hypothetical protein